MPRPFRIAEAHMEAFAEQQRERFEDEMVVHLTREFLDEATKMGEEWLRELIREGIQVAKGYNITLERDVARYIELMIAVSPAFDESEKTPWAKEILTDKWMTGQEKLDRLYEHIMFEPEPGDERETES